MTTIDLSQPLATPSAGLPRRKPAGGTPFRPGPDRAAASEARHLLAAGLVRTVIGDVLVPAGPPDDRATRIAAAALLLPVSGRHGQPVRAVVGYGSAVWVHAGWSAQRWRAPEQLEVVVPPGSCRPGGSALHVHQSALSERDVELLDGLPVTTPARTAVDVARGLPRRHALPALAALRAVTGVRPEEALARLSGLPSARNAVAARQLLREWAAEG